MLKRLLKPISWALIFSFTLTSGMGHTPSVYAQNPFVISRSESDEKSRSFADAQDDKKSGQGGIRGTVDIPKEFGSIERVFWAERSKVPGTFEQGPSVYYIQDAHNSLEAQENIAKLIQHLVKEKNVGQVLVEGYEGEVPLDKIFSGVTDPTVKERVSHFFVDYLRLNGARYAFVNRDPAHDFKLIGIESTQDYLDNLKAYEEGARDREAVAHDLGKISKELQALADRIYPKEIKEWQKLKGRFDSKQLSLADYVFRIFKLAPSPSLSHEGRGSREEDPSPLMGEGKGEGEAYPHLALITSYLGKDNLTKEEQDELNEKFKRIDSKVFFAELQQFEREFSGKYLTDPVARQTFAYQQQIALLNKLDQFQLTPEEYQELKLSPQPALGTVLGEERTVPGSGGITDEIAHFLATNLYKSLVLSSRWEELIAPQIRFYELAKKRDGNFQKSLGTVLMKQEGQVSRTRDLSLQKNIAPVIVVAGGFHQSGITEFLEKEQISFTVISPKITKDDPIHEKRYDFLMAGSDYPFERSFATAPLAALPKQIEMMGSGAERLVLDAARSLDPDGRVNPKRLQAISAVEQVNRIVAKAQGKSLGDMRESWEKENPWINPDSFTEWLMKQPDMSLTFVRSLLAGQLRMASTTERQILNENTVFKEFCEMLGLEPNPEWDKDSGDLDEATQKRFMDEVLNFDREADRMARKVRQGVLGQEKYRKYGDAIAKNTLTAEDKKDIRQDYQDFIRRYAERLLRGQGLTSTMLKMSDRYVYGKIDMKNISTDLDLFVKERINVLTDEERKRLDFFKSELAVGKVEPGDIRRLVQLAGGDRRIREAFIFIVDLMREKAVEGMSQAVRRNHYEIIEALGKKQPLTSSQQAVYDDLSSQVQLEIRMAANEVWSRELQKKLLDHDQLIKLLILMSQNRDSLNLYKQWIRMNFQDIAKSQKPVDEASSSIRRRFTDLIGRGDKKNPQETQVFMPVDQIGSLPLKKQIEIHDPQYQSAIHLAGLLSAQQNELFDAIFEKAEDAFRNKAKGASLGGKILKPILTDPLQSAFQSLNNGKPLPIFEVEGVTSAPSASESVVDYTDIRGKLMAAFEDHPEIAPQDYAALILRRSHRNFKDAGKTRDYYRILVDRSSYLQESINSMWLQDELGKFEFVLEFVIYPEEKLVHFNYISLGREHVDTLRGKGVAPLRDAAKVLEENFRGFQIVGVSAELKGRATRIIPKYLEKYFQAKPLDPESREAVELAALLDLTGNDTNYLYQGVIGASLGEEGKVELRKAPFALILAAVIGFTAVAAPFASRWAQDKEPKAVERTVEKPRAPPGTETARSLADARDDKKVARDEKKIAQEREKAEAARLDQIERELSAMSDRQREKIYNSFITYLTKEEVESFGIKGVARGRDLMTDQILKIFSQLSIDRVLKRIASEVNKKVKDHNAKNPKLAYPELDPEIFKLAANEEGIDVFFLVALAFQETEKFDFQARSGPDGRGLIQINPTTLEHFWPKAQKLGIVPKNKAFADISAEGIDRILFNPNNNIRIAAVVLTDYYAQVDRHIEKLDKEKKRVATEGFGEIYDRMRFAVLSYSRGTTHVLKAITQAAKEKANYWDYETITGTGEGGIVDASPFGREYPNDKEGRRKVSIGINYVNTVLGNLKAAKTGYYSFFVTTDAIRAKSLGEVRALDQVLEKLPADQIIWTDFVDYIGLQNETFRELSLRDTGAFKIEKAISELPRPPDDLKLFIVQLEHAFLRKRIQYYRTRESAKQELWNLIAQLIEDAIRKDPTNFIHPARLQDVILDYKKLIGQKGEAFWTDPSSPLRHRDFSQIKKFDEWVGALAPQAPQKAKVHSAIANLTNDGFLRLIYGEDFGISTGRSLGAAQDERFAEIDREDIGRTRSVLEGATRRYLLGALQDYEIEEIYRDALLHFFNRRVLRGKAGAGGDKSYVIRSFPDGTPMKGIFFSDFVIQQEGRTIGNFGLLPDFDLKALKIVEVFRIEEEHQGQGLSTKIADLLAAITPGNLPVHLVSEIQNIPTLVSLVKMLPLSDRTEVSQAAVAQFESQKQMTGTQMMGLIRNIAPFTSRYTSEMLSQTMTGRRLLHFYRDDSKLQLTMESDKSIIMSITRPPFFVRSVAPAGREPNVLGTPLGSDTLRSDVDRLSADGSMPSARLADLDGLSSQGQSLGGAAGELMSLMKVEDVMRESAVSGQPFQVESLRPSLEGVLKRPFSITQVHFRLKMKTKDSPSADDILGYLKRVGAGDPVRILAAARREIKRSADLISNQIEKDTKRLVQESQEVTQDYWRLSIIDDLEKDLEIILSLPGTDPDRIAPVQVKKFIDYSESAVMGLMGQNLSPSKFGAVAEELERVSNYLDARLPVSESDLRKIQRLIADFGDTGNFTHGSSLGDAVKELSALVKVEDVIKDQAEFGQPFDLELLRPGLVEVLRRPFSITQAYFRLKLETDSSPSADDILKYLKRMGAGDPVRTLDVAQLEIRRSADLLSKQVWKDTKLGVREAQKIVKDHWRLSIINDLQRDLMTILYLPRVDQNNIDPAQVKKFIKYSESTVMGLKGQTFSVLKELSATEELERVNGLLADRLPVKEEDLRRIYFRVADLAKGASLGSVDRVLDQLPIQEMTHFDFLDYWVVRVAREEDEFTSGSKAYLIQKAIDELPVPPDNLRAFIPQLERIFIAKKLPLFKRGLTEPFPKETQAAFRLLDWLIFEELKDHPEEMLNPDNITDRLGHYRQMIVLYGNRLWSGGEASILNHPENARIKQVATHLSLYEDKEGLRADAHLAVVIAAETYLNAFISASSLGSEREDLTGKPYRDEITPTELRAREFSLALHALVFGGKTKDGFEHEGLVIARLKLAKAIADGIEEEKKKQAGVLAYILQRVRAHDQDINIGVRIQNRLTLFLEKLRTEDPSQYAKYQKYLDRSALWNLENNSYDDLKTKARFLRSEINKFDSKFSRAVEADVDARLHELNAEIRALLTVYNKIQLKRALHFMEGKPPESWNTTAIVNLLLSVRNHTKRHELEVLRENIRNKKREIVRQFSAETAAYKEIDLDLLGTAKIADILTHLSGAGWDIRKSPSGGYIVPQRRWVKYAGKTHEFYRSELKEIPYQDLSSAIRSQVHTIESQLLDIGVIQERVGDLEDALHQIRGYSYRPVTRKEMKRILRISGEIEEWLEKGLVDPKTLSLPQIKTAKAALEEASKIPSSDIERRKVNFGIVESNVRAVIDRLESDRLQEINRIKRKVGNRLLALARTTQTAENRIIFRTSEILYGVSRLESALGTKQPLDLTQEKDKVLLGRYKDIVRDVYRLKNGYFASAAGGSGYRRSHPLIVGVASALYRLEKVLEGGGTIEKSGVDLNLVKQNLIMIQANMIYLNESDADFKKKSRLIEARIAPRTQEIVARIAKLEELRAKQRVKGSSLGLKPSEIAELHGIATRFLSENLKYLDAVIRDLEVMDKTRNSRSTEEQAKKIGATLASFKQSIFKLQEEGARQLAVQLKTDPTLKTNPALLYSNTLSQYLNRSLMLSLQQVVGAITETAPMGFYANSQYVKGVKKLELIMKRVPDTFDFTVVEDERLPRLDTDKILGQSLGKSHLDSIEETVRKVAAVIGLPDEVLKKVMEPDHIFRVEYKVKLKDGTEIPVLAFRVQHSNARGPYKGGIRYISIPINEEEAEKTDKALAFGMSLKTAVVNLPLGGGKGVVNFVVKKDDLLNRTTGERDLAKEEEFQAKLIRGYVRALMDQSAQDPKLGRDAVGAMIDSPAPDMGTGAKQMAWATDEYLRILLERMRDKKGAGIYEPRLGARLLAFFTDPANTSLFEDASQVVVLKKYLELIKEPDMVDRVGSTPEIAAFTGKPAGTPPGKPEDPKSPYLGGSQGRDKATGQGGLFVLETALHKLRGEKRLRDLEVAVQGYGNVGGEFSKLLFDRGVKIAAISTAYKTADGKYSPYTIYHKDGIDIKALEEWIRAEMAVQKVDRPDAFSYEAFATKQGYQVIPNDDFWGLPVDVFVPAAAAGVITKEAAEKIAGTARTSGRKPIILELANGPTTPEADEVLKPEGIVVIPDILANAGGVSVSFSEMHQNIANERWDVRVVDRVLKEKMVDATSRIIDIQDLYRQKGINLSMREATYLVAVMKLAFAEIARDPALKQKYGTLDFIKNSQGLILPDTQETLRLAIQQGLAPQMIEKSYNDLDQQVANMIHEISLRFSVNPNRHHAVLVTGATASGKSVVIDDLKRRLEAQGKKVRVLDLNREQVSPENMQELMAGKAIQVEAREHTLLSPIMETIEPVSSDEIVILEGSKSYGYESVFGAPNVYRIFVHSNPNFSFTVNGGSAKYPLTSFNLRLFRDLIMLKRNLGIRLDGPFLIQNLRNWTRHRNYENTTIFPNLERADQVFNIYDPFEIAVMRKDIMDILKGVSDELTRREKAGQQDINLAFWRTQVDFMKSLMIRTPSLELAQIPEHNTFNFLVEGKSLGVRTELDRAAQPYIDLISKGDVLFPEVPDVFLVLGNPDIQTYLSFADEWKKIWKDRQKIVPIVLAGGRGRGTPVMIDKLMAYYGERRELNADDLMWFGRAKTDEKITEADLMRFALMKEGVLDGAISKEIEPSSNTAANFTNSRDVVRRVTQGIAKPTVAVVTAPQLLLRTAATARKLWQAEIALGWNVKNLKLYDVRVKDLKDDQLIDLMGYVAGYPEKYRTLYPALNGGSEFRGSQSKNNPNVETPPMTEEAIRAGDKLEEDAKAAFERFLDAREVVYDAKWNRLITKGSSLGTSTALSVNAREVAGDVAHLAEKPAVVAVSFAEWGRFGVDVHQEILKHLLEERIKIVLTDVPAGETLPTVFQQKSKLIHVLSGPLTSGSIAQIQGFTGDQKIVHLSERMKTPEAIASSLNDAQRERFIFVQPKNEKGVVSAALLFASGTPRYQEAFKKDPSGFWVPTELGKLIASLAQDFLATQVLAQAA